MREIKFRGIKTGNQGFRYGCYHKLGKQHFIRNGSVMSSVIPETVGQYTGVRDKNKKECYEGDIVEVYGGFKYEVTFSFGSFRFGDYLYPTSYLDSDTFEIIGNVYENAELLEVK